MPRYWREEPLQPRRRTLQHEIKGNTPQERLAEFLAWAKTWPLSLKEYYLSRIQQDPDHVDELGIEGLTAEELLIELRKAWAG